jgi:addiction module HigA family antidote
MTAPRKTKRLPPVHPGEVLREDLLKELGLSEFRLAKDIGVPPLRINQIVKGKRAITADTALRLGRYFGTTAEFWMNMQGHYDLEVARDRLEARINREVQQRKAA